MRNKFHRVLKNMQKMKEINESVIKEIERGGGGEESKVLENNNNDDEENN